MSPSLKVVESSRRQLPAAVRIAAAAILIVMLFLATMNSEALYSLFGRFWLKLFTAAGISAQGAALSQSGGTIGLVTNRPRNTSAILSYSVVYLGMCLAILFLLLPSAPQRKLVLIFYCVAAGLFIILLFVAKLGFPSGMELSNELIHFIVSPIPVVILFPLLKWYLPDKRVV